MTRKLIKTCDYCNLPIADNDWYLWDTNCLVRLMVECTTETAHKYYGGNHRHCKLIDKNRSDTFRELEERTQKELDRSRGGKVNHPIKFGPKFRAMMRIMGGKQEEEIA